MITTIPVTARCVQWTGDNRDEIIAFIRAADPSGSVFSSEDGQSGLCIGTRGMEGARKVYDLPLNGYVGVVLGWVVPVRDVTVPRPRLELQAAKWEVQP